MVARAAACMPLLRRKGPGVDCLLVGSFQVARDTSRQCHVMSLLRPPIVRLWHDTAVEQPNNNGR